MTLSLNRETASSVPEVNAPRQQNLWTALRRLLAVAVVILSLTQPQPAHATTGTGGGACFCFVFLGCVGANFDSNYGVWFSTCGPSVTGDPQCLMSVSGAVGLTDPVCEIMVELNLMLQGATGKAIASVALIVLGLMALFGKISWQLSVVLISGIALLFGSSSIMLALGAGNLLNSQVGFDPISLTLSNLTNQITGTTGRAIGVVALIIVGMGGLFGKVSWPQALALMVGIGLVYGGADLVGMLAFPTDQYLTACAGVDRVCDPFFQLVDLMTSESGVSIGTFGVIIMGFMAMLGKLSWVRAILLATGIALMFAAANVVAVLTGPLNPCTLPSSDPFTEVICGFMEELQGPLGKALATIGVIVIGILSMIGKISWELAFVVAVGVALIFGANSLVESFETTMAGVNCGTTPPSAPSTGNAIADVLCYIINILYGPAGKALACVAVIMMGLGALMGKVSYAQAMIVCAGIAVTFGAPQIVQIVLPSANTTGCTIISGGGFASLAC